uniref:Myocardial zonula adherens protein n=1 Tax=Latimeria chalumnae TaxID=7897 RepID=H3AXK4_LATCH
SNGVSKKSLPSGVVFGVVRRPEAEDQKEMVVYEWSVNQLKEEMNYIKEVRTSLEQVREKMYGEYNGMKERMQQLINEMKVANVQQDVLQHTLQSQSAALENCSQLNSSLATETIDLQKTLLNTTLENSNMRDEIRSLKQSMEKLKEKDKQLEAAQTENAVLKLKVESSQQANAEAMRDLTRKLYDQYEAKLKEQEQKHYAEKAAIQLHDTIIKSLPERLFNVTCSNFPQTMKDYHSVRALKHLTGFQSTRHWLATQGICVGSVCSKQCVISIYVRSQRLEEEATSLKERIRHLDNMVHCQQKKVKQMIEEVETLKQKIQEKDLFIEQLLEKISFLEAENKELQDKLDYLKSASELVQNHVETTEVEHMISCDLLYRSQYKQEVTSSYCGRRPESRLSPAERRMRDKKHLDDITAARLPPLHHMPTLLLSLEESVALHMEQKQNYEDAQAKLAAQKLGEKLNIKMVSFSPEGEAIKTYREIQDEEECHSSDEDLL